MSEAKLLDELLPIKEKIMNRKWVALAFGFLVIAGLFSFPSPGNSQGAKENSEMPKIDQWKRWRAIVGNWEGPSEGKSGIGRTQFEASFVLGERYLKLLTTADYRNDKGGEHHEDFGFVSFDSGRKTHVFRQFHIEGFVNQYVLVEGTGNDPLELISESCENSPPGWKARERYIVLADTIEHTFELAPPNMGFEVYSKSTLTRVKN